MTTTSDSGITIADGVLAGQLRRSVNNSHNQKGSIHDDATASKLGFRGGTVAGSIHNELFTPLLLAGFGKRWFERGTLSMYYMNATTDREAVQAFLKQPALGARDAQVEAWVTREDGMQVAQGTASVGNPTDATALLARPLDRFDVGELRILNGVGPGFRFEPQTVVVTAEQQRDRLAVTTEPLEWFSGDSPWGGPVVMLAPMVQMLYAKVVTAMRGTLGAVGLFGAIELRNINGPVLVGREYRCTGEVFAVGQSPKTEYMWFETGLDDESGRRVAEMRMQLRFMKASSKLYPELRGE
ncbi:MAG: hypothetical protein ABI577_02395 [bacterium]